MSQSCPDFEKYKGYKDSLKALLETAKSRPLTAEEEKLRSACMRRIKTFEEEHPEAKEDFFGNYEGEPQWDWDKYEYKEEEEQDRKEAKARKEEQRKKKLRGTVITLTYPHYDPGDDLNSVISQLSQVLNKISLGTSMKEYLAAKEEHIDGTPHIHVYLKCSKRIRFNPEDFDIFDATGELRHPHVQVGIISSLKNIIEYYTKEGNFVTNIDIESYLKKKGKKCQEILEESPTKLVKEDAIRWDQFDKLIKNQAAWATTKAQKEAKQEAESEELPKKRHKWIYGECNTGKTTQMKAFMKEHEGDAFKMPSNNDWQFYRGQHYLCFDGMTRATGTFLIPQLELIADGNVQLNTKGSSTSIPIIKEIRIYSNFSIEATVPESCILPLKARFEEIHLTQVFSEPKSEP